MELFDIHNPDIILCDIRMPVMDGLTLIGELRERGSKAEIILLTGYQEFEYARAGIKYKVRDYICKPIHYKELENTIRAVGEQIVQQRLKDPFQQTVSRIEETEGQQSARKTRSSSWPKPWRTLQASWIRIWGSKSLPGIWESAAVISASCSKTIWA
ncbi:response regulator [Paenibacillus sp. JTLBN-2024]